MENNTQKEDVQQSDIKTDECVSKLSNQFSFQKWKYLIKLSQINY